MELPTQIIKATSDISPRILLLYGPPKVGKTEILSALPNNLIVDLEDGSDSVSALKIKISSLAKLAELILAVEKAGKPYDYVSIDTIDKLEDWCEIHATAAYKASAIGKSFQGSSVLELPNGGGYFWLRNSFLLFFHMCKKLATHVIFVGHVRDRYLTTDGKDVVTKDLNLTGQIKNMACANADAIGHVYRTKEGILNISFQTKDAVVCGSRSPHLANAVIQFTSPKATVQDWQQIYKDIKIS